MAFRNLWNIKVLHKIIFVWLISAVIEISFCTQHDVHRIVLKTHQRRVRDRDVHKSHSSHQYRKPSIYESFEDDWYPSSTRTPHIQPINKNHRPSHRYNNKRTPPRNRTTSAQKPKNATTHLEITTHFPATEMSIPKFEETFTKYNILKNNRNKNNSIDIYEAVESKLNQYINNRTHEMPPLNKTEIGKIKGYEVYEEIIGDLKPPTVPIAYFSGQFPIVVPKDEENHIKENVSDYQEGKNKTVVKRTKTRRARGGDLKID